tara:strand:- start:29 stop:895 length:867 start_codon:yes stop_codon:yes gene_type:complete
MNVLSLFDGMSCGQIALEKCGIKVNNYFASEIDKTAIRCTKHNYPNTIHLGSALDFKFNGLPKIDLLIGGSPCQDFSIANKKGQSGLEGDKSKLFYTFLDVLREVKPKYFLLENVKMKKESKLELDKYLGVSGILIDSNLVSYQNRSRYYWSNIPNITKPNDKNISFQDFKETEDCDSIDYSMPNKTPSRIRMWNNGKGKNNQGSCANITKRDKIYCLTTKQDRCPNSGMIEHKDFGRYLTRRELELAQTVPVGYTDCVSYNQAQALLGNGWTVDVIAHIFKGLNHIN